MTSGRTMARGASVSTEAGSAVAAGSLDLLVAGAEDRFIERTIRISQLTAEEADGARAVIQARIPPRTGRVT